MVVSEGAINNIMGGMENTAGVRLHSHRHKLKQRFDIIRKLGQGTYGKVQLAVNKETGQEVAIKTIKKAKIETEQDLIRIRREIQIMSSVQHPQIIHIYEVFENREKMVLVMEYAAGGELYDYLSERKVLSEDEARRVFRHVASATYYCHKHKICHRDLKLENILLDLDGNAKIADFGLSNVFDEKHRLDTFCGSPLYASPEIVKGIPYIGPEVDCWSLGVLLYTLVYGAMPFDGSNFKRLVKQITQGDYYEPKKPSRASELIRHMLTVSATKRATIEEICSHWWVDEGFNESCLDLAEALANQTPVRLDLLLSLAPKHINSEHMLIQPEDDDNSARSPPNSEAARPPPNLKLPPPPPAEAPVQITPTRSASLGALSSISTNEIEALVVQKMQKRKEEEEEEEEERKRKAADETGTVERRKKKRESSDASLKAGRKEQKRSEETGSGTRRPPAGPESESAERKKTSRRKEGAEAEEQEKAEQRKSGEKKKRESLLVDGEANDVSERSEWRKSTKKADGEKAERKKSVKKRESGVERNASEGGDRTERKKSAKKRDSMVTPDSSVERKKTSRKKGTSGDDLSGRDDGESAFVSSSVINGEAGDVGEEEEEGGERGESGIELGGSSKEPARLDQLPSLRESRGSAEGKVRSGDQQESPMEVEEDVKKSPSRSRSGESSRVTKGTIKASGSSRESVSPVKQPGGAAPPPTPTTTTTTTTTTAAITTTTTAAAVAASSQESPRKKPSPPPSQPPKVSDARRAFEVKPAEKPTITLRKKSTAETLPTSPTPAKDTPAAPTKEPATGKSPAREKPSPVKDLPKEIEKQREKSPRVGKETPSRVGSKSKMEAEAEKKKVEEPAKKEKPEVSKKTPSAATAVTEKPSKAEERTVTSRPTEPSHKQTTAKEKETKEEAPADKSDKPSKVEPKQILHHRDSSESSESESEAERLLKVLSEKREKVEAAKQEKLRKVSGTTKEPQADMAAVSEEPQPKSPSKLSPTKSPTKTSPSKSPEKALPPPDGRETAPEQKFATLPRGFKTKGPTHAASPTTTPASLPPPADRPKKDRGAINQEIEGMMSAIKAVDQAITKVPSEGAQKTPEALDTDRKKTKLEIVLNNKQPAQQQQPEAKRASYAEIKLTSPSTTETPRTPGFRSEVCATVGAVPIEPVTGPKPGPGPGPRPGPGPGLGPGETHLQRAKRERIIPIMLEDDDEDDDTTASESHIPLDSNRRPGSSMSCGSARITPLTSQLPNSRLPDPRTPPVYTPAPEPIRKSRRERIIPIAVEGEGLVTPPPHMEEGAGLGASRAHQAFSRTLSGRPNTLSRGRGFLLDHSESFSSAGEEEEEDEDDGFQILTAESLFSTLLNRVRSLTRKMNAEDGRGDRVRRTSNRPTPEPSAPAGVPGAVHSGSAGFWSSLYNSPRDSPARRISDTMSRSSLGRDEDGLGGLGSPLWTRSVSRDPSDADTLFSETSSSAQFGTLPRGWRASRWSGAEDGGESDTSEASVRSIGRRPQYSRAPSRELHNIPDEDVAVAGGRGGYAGGGMSLPRPYSASSGGNLQQGRAMQDSADRIAAMYGTLRGPMRRPHSTVGGTPGEYLGRDGGHCEQRQHNSAATHNGAHASQYSPSDSQQHANDDTDSLKQSVQEQLQQLVRELEEGDNSTPPGEWRGRGRGGVSRSLYASNPALHLTCPAGLAWDHRSISNADLSTAANSSSSSSCLAHNEVAVNSRNNRTMLASSMAHGDGTGRRAPLQSGGGGATSLLSRDRTGSLRGVPSSRGEWTRPGGSAVRGGDSSALDALRRNPGRGGLDLHTYQRGRSEDLRHALDSISRTDSHKSRRVSSMADGASHVSRDRPDGRALTENCVADHRNDIDAEPSSKTVPRRPPVTGTIATSDKNNNSSSLGASKSSSGIPVKVSTGSVVKGVRTNQVGTTNTTPTNTNNSTTAIPDNNKNINNKDSNSSNIPRTSNDLLQPAKVYRKSKSRDLTPTIEAASEKISQLNSGTLKRISPFEAYRRTKSRELPLEHINANSINNNRESSPVARLKSPPQVSPERPTSPLEKTKTSVEEKTDVTKPPAGEREAGGLGGASSPQPSASLSRSPSAAKSERPTNGSTAAAKASGRVDKTTEHREAEKSEDKAKVKKTPSGDSDKPKSMYKMLTSRFNRSASFVSDNSRSAGSTAAEDDEGGEKEDKFRLKRPSRFLKPRTEKSASKTSMCDTDDDADKQEKKPSKKLTDALNKFLGRKDSTKEEARPAGQVGNKAAAPGKAPPDDNQPRKPPRAKGKKSDENQSTAQTEEDGGGERAQKVVSEANPAPAPATTTTAAQPSYTLESATKSICNHLSQLESDITSRIGNMGTQEQRGGGSGGVRPGGSSSGRVAAAAAGPNISTYGLSPALANRRNGRPTNLDAAASNMKGGQHAVRAPSAPPPGRAPATTKSGVASRSAITECDKVKAQRPQEASSPSPPPTECPEEQRGQSEAEDESVMDRITRKSYYSKFQEKKRPKLWRANTREDMDQQLAAAKARLLKEEREEAALAGRRLSSPRSPPPWDPHRPASRTSLPPEDAVALMQLGGQRSSSLQPDHLLGPLPPVMLGESAPHHRPPSLPPDDRYLYPCAPSVPRDDYLPRGARMQSSPPEDLLTGQYSRRASSMAPDDLSARPAGEPYVQDAMTAAMTAGSLAGQVAADGALQRGEPGSREPSVGRMRSPELTTVEESRTQAREELSRRLTHLTRLSGGSGLSGWSRGAQREGEQRPYRRTSTTGRLAGETTGTPVYRRTNTMDLPPADARARPGSEYRRHLQQDPTRRYSTARTLVEGEPLTNPSPSPHSCLTPQPQHLNPTRLSHPTPYIPPSYMHSPSSTSSSSSHLTSPSSGSSSYRGSGPYSPSSSALDSACYNSSLGRKTSFYRY